MCGIGGILVDRNETVMPDGLRRMSSCMTARGPDAEGLFIGNGIGLVHRRLSILDLSDLGNCPMPNEDGSVQALLNGEIYNWRELRKELLTRGHEFRSLSDSEVVSHGYEEWGEDLFPRLRGMFALAIWDQSRERLLLARDRVGEKPLFVHHDERRTVFGSSIAAVLAYERNAPAINADALVCCLAHGFIPATHTAWAGVNVFPSGHYAIVRRGGRFSPQPYWSLRCEPARSGSIAVAERDVEHALEDSVRRCLDADVPVGIFLSGGVDSSVVAALASRHIPRMNSFALGFEEAEWSELEHSRKVARHLGLEHHEVIVRPADVLRTLPLLVWHYGQPFGDASAIPTHLLSRLARKHVKVCLSGDGGDESFAGYWRVQSGLYAARYASLVPKAVRQHIVPKVADLIGHTGKRLAAMNTLSLAPPGCGYTNFESWHTAIAEVAGPALRPGIAHDRVACRVGHPVSPQNATVVQRLQFDDFRVQLPDDYLTKVDVASMAASLEVRAPMLDVGVIETAWRLPDRMKIRWGQRKWILKRIARRLVPPDVVDRPKMGFAMPLPRWFKAELGHALERLLTDSVAKREGWIDSERVLHELRDHRNGVQNNQTRLWLILWLELWFRIVVYGDMSRDTDLSEIFETCAS